MELDSKKSTITFNVGQGQEYEIFSAESLERMFNAAAQNGVKKNGIVCVRLSSGEYIISESLALLRCKYKLHIKSGGNASIIGDGTNLFTLRGSRLTLEGVRVLDAQSDHGGAIRMSRKSELVLKNCEFINNSAATGGCIWSENSEVLIDDCVFAGNSAESAGVIYMSGGSIEIKNSRLINNRTENSHAVMKLQNQCCAKLMALEIANNYAGQYYGSISAMSGCELYMDECNVSGNVADGDVGGIFAAQRCSVTMIDCTIQNNIADNSTGVLIADKSKLIMYDSSICANTARKSCAGIMAAANSNVTVNNSEICENLAQNAGAISSHPDCVITLNSSKILGNRAENNIGAIGASGRLVIKDCVIRNNTAVSQAGGILVGDQARVNINGCTILDNCAGLGLNILLVPDGDLKINKYSVLFNVNTPVTPQTVF